MDKVDEAQFGEVVDSLYASALGEQTWVLSLEKVRALFSARSAQLFTGRSKNGLLDFPFSVRAFNADAPHIDSGDLHTENWNGLELAIDPRMSYAASKPRGAIYFDHQFISDDEIARHPFYQEILAKFGGKYHLGTNLHVETDQIVAMTLNWNGAQGHATKAESDLLSRLVPHVQRSYKVSISLKDANAEKDTLLGLLTQTSTGVAVLDRLGRVLDMNHKLEEFIADRDGVSFSNHHISFTGDRTRSHIDGLIGSALNRFGIEPKAIRDEFISRPSGQHPYIVNLIPVQAGTPWYRGNAALVLTIIDPARRSSLSQRLIQRYFMLSPAEALVAIEISNGLSIEELAMKNGVASSTIRSQLKSVFEKTDTHRQNELASLISKLPGASAVRDGD